MVSQILIIIFLTLVNGLFAMSEIAFVSLNDNKIKVKAEDNDKKSVILFNLLKDSNKFLSTIQIGITLAGFLSSAFASDAFSDRLISLIQTQVPNLNPTTFKPVAMTLVTLILSYFTIVFGEMVPKRIGMTYAEKISYSVVYIINFMSKITTPVVSLLSGSTNIVVRLLGIDPDADTEEITEEEIRMMVDVGEEKGNIRENEKTMIFNIFNFDNQPVTDIMTHRTDILAVNVESTPEEVRDFLFNQRYSRFPIYEESLDKIIGVIHLKDLLKTMKDGKFEDFNLRQIMRPAYFVPDTIYTDEVFYDMQSKKIHLAIVVDEYGGTAGLITIEDLLEEIVGEIFDEYDEEEDKEIEKVNDRQFLIDGDVPLDHVEQMIYIDLPLDDYETLSGFMVGLLGQLPQLEDIGRTFEFNGYVFKILDVSQHYIERIELTKLPDPEQDDAN